MQSNNRHTLSQFADSLEKLQSDVLTMASLCRRSFEQAANSLLERDRNALSLVIADEEEINYLEKKVDALGIEIITRYQPVAVDLRTVTGNMKVASNLERIGDESLTISRRSRKLLDRTELSITQKLAPLFSFASEMLRDSFVAYTERNSALASAVIGRDTKLDNDHKELISELSESLQGDQDAETVLSYVDLLFILRSIERVGDHAKNISEETIFVEEAVDVRHGGEL